MAGTTKPDATQHPRHPLLSLIERWRSEPGDYDERVGDELDRELPEERLRLREPDVPWDEAET